MRENHMSIYKSLVANLILLIGLNACASKQSPEDELPPQDLPRTPNCAADGPDCKQFNPDLK